MNQFAESRYIALETFRRNGEGVKTTVWFVERDGKVYVWTIGHSGKAKRIRNNPSVRVAASNARGKPQAEWREAKAHVLKGEPMQEILNLMRRKYGLQFWFLRRIHGRGRILIEIELAH